MAKLTRVDVERMKRKDKEHLIFDGKDGLTKRLPIQQIEAIFPDSLLLLTDIAYDVDSEGNLVIASAVVSEFCETTQQAVDYFYSNMGSDADVEVPYHTGVTKFNHDRYLSHVGNPNFSNIAKTEQKQYAEKELEFPFSPINTENVSIKDLDYISLFDFFLSLDLSVEVSKKLVADIKKDVSTVSTPDFGYDSFVSIILRNLSNLGYQPTEHFNPLLNGLMEKHYSHLIKRDKAVIFYNIEDKDFLTDYCKSKQYRYFFMRSTRFVDLLSAMLEGKLKKVVLADSTMERMSVVKAKVLGMLAVKCDVRIEIVSP